MNQSNLEESLYRILQPTGLMYGHPVELPYMKHPKIHEWGAGGKMAVILSESMINSAMLPILPHASPDEVRELSWEIILRSADYFPAVYPEIGSKYNFGSGKMDALLRAEKILSTRLFHKSSSKNSWKSFFHNSLLFLDVYYYGQWYNQGMDSSVLESIREKKNHLKYKILELIACAAHADQSVVKEERDLFYHFLDSANLPKPEARKAAKLIEQPVLLEEIEFDQLESWVIKKYFLELAMLTIWADRIVNVPEQKFIVQLSERLGFPREELENSMISIQSFVLGHWEDIHFLQGKHDFIIVRNHFTKRLGKIILKNKDRIAQEIKESRELVELLNKSKATPLSDEEKAKVREQLIDILKVIPTLVIIALPFTFITLPLMLKLLPKSSFPSAFQD